MIKFFSEFYLLIVAFIISSICAFLLWYLYLRKNKKEEWGKDFIYRCPRCLSTNLGYLGSLSNYIEVFKFNKKPEYTHIFYCHNCDYQDLQDKLIKEEINDKNKK